MANKYKQNNNNNNNNNAAQSSRTGPRYSKSDLTHRSRSRRNAELAHDSGRILVSSSYVGNKDKSATSEIGDNARREWLLSRDRGSEVDYKPAFDGNVDALIEDGDDDDLYARRTPVLSRWKVARKRRAIDGVLYRREPKQTRPMWMSAAFVRERIEASQVVRAHDECVELSLQWDDSFEEVVASPDLDKVARLAHDLDRVVKVRGVHETSSFGAIGKSLSYVHQPNEIAFENLPPFVPPSRDARLGALRRRADVRFAGSTSSVTGVLSHIFWALSDFQPLNLSTLSGRFSSRTHSIAPAQLKVQSVVLRAQASDADGPSGYVIDHVSPMTIGAGADEPDVGEQQNEILMSLGHSLERQLTMSPESFEAAFVRGKCTAAAARRMRAGTEPYHFVRLGNMLLRSQIDCAAPNLLPHGRCTFDLKTRAVSPIRRNVKNYVRFRNYKLSGIDRDEHTYEHEFYDMARSAFLKYSLQARIGHMHGIFVAHHNTAELLGFEYLPLDEIETYVYGCPEFADIFFRASNALMQRAFQRIADDCEPGADIRVAMRARRFGCLDFFVEHMIDDDGVSRAPRHYELQASMTINDTPITSMKTVPDSIKQHPHLYYSITEHAADSAVAANFAYIIAQRKFFA
jgi:Mitochondrial protein Pet127